MDVHCRVRVVVRDPELRVGSFVDDEMMMFAGHALVTFDDMGADPTGDDARHILAWLERTGCPRFTQRELFSAMAAEASGKPVISTRRSQSFRRMAMSRPSQSPKG